MSALPKLKSPHINAVIHKATSTVKTAIASGEVQTLEELRNEIYTQYFKSFKSLDTVRPNPQPYLPTHHRDVEIFNSNLNSFASSFDVAVEETKDLQAIIISQHSLVELGSEEALINIANVASDLDAIENSIEREQFYSKGKRVITLEDNFDDVSKLDFTRMESPGNLIKGFGIELGVDSDANRTSNIKDVQIINISTGKTPDPTLTEDDKLPIRPEPYEGKRFSTPDDARPEGGNWRIESINTDVATLTPGITKGTTYVNLKEKVWTAGSILGSGTPPTVTPPALVATPRYRIYNETGAEELSDATAITTPTPTSTELTAYTDSGGT